ncbi:HNH endonuclease [Candidatus Woesebacteria bacterium]|nr:HNH endonuclease [Candidatus Woesebacteria bacterium]
MTNQIYENYWQFTAAFTDYHGKGFLTTLKIIIDFIDMYKHEEYSKNKYERLQESIQKEWAITMPSIRKIINQLVKMGFVEPLLVSYSTDCINYLEAKSNRKRKSLLSKIVYSNSGLNKSVKKESKLNQINFLINTLTENGKLTRNEIIALMQVDINKVQKGYLNKNELETYIEQFQEIDFEDRKYNQIQHLFNLLRELDGIQFIGTTLHFKDDAEKIIEELPEQKGRNKYLHTLYKNQLKNEAYTKFHKEKCMVEHLTYPILIASHIKPFILSTKDEAYNPNNGLLLSKNLDGLFDHGLISFDNDGKIIISKRLDSELQKHLNQYQLEKVFVNEERKKFLEFHRTHFKDRLFE